MPFRSFVTVASYDSSVEAWLMHNQLEAVGLSPIVTDEHVVNVYWLYSNAIGGVKVQVPDSELDDFRCWENQIESNESLDTALREESSEGEESGEGEEPFSCPECCSIELCQLGWHRRHVFLSWLVIGFPVPIRTATVRCLDCGYESPSRFDFPDNVKATQLFVLAIVILFMITFLMFVGYDWLAFLSGASTRGFIY